MRCFGFGWDLVSAVAAGFVGRRKFGNGLYYLPKNWGQSLAHKRATLILRF